MPSRPPPYCARNAREKDAMRDWMCDQLKAVIAPPIDEANPGGLDATEFELLILEKALAELEAVT